MNPTVIGVQRSGKHTTTKYGQDSIRLIQGFGVEGDAHAGATVKHRSRVKKDPDQPNLRQVHLIQAELFDELNGAGFDVSPGIMGENIATRGLDLLSLSTGTRLHIGTEAVVEVTGLRDPCWQLDKQRDGLMAATLDKDAEGNVIRKAGVMSVVVAGGDVRPGDAIRVEEPNGDFSGLKPV